MTWAYKDRSECVIFGESFNEVRNRITMSIIDSKTVKGLGFDFVGAARYNIKGNGWQRNGVVWFDVAINVLVADCGMFAPVARSGRG